MARGSILQNDKVCVFCREVLRLENTTDLHKHHIFGGSRRTTSDKNGFWIWLCADHHDMSDAGIHFNRKMDLCAKRACQRAYEAKHSHEEFMALIGRNYLDVVA